MKRLIAILAVLALCLSVLPMAAFAVDKTFYMAGTLAPGGWDPGAEANKMTLVNGLWTITNHVAAGSYAFKFTSGGWGQDEYPAQGDLAVTVESECDVTVTYDPATNKYTVTGDGIPGPAYYLAGSFNDWNVAGYKMTKSGNIWKYTISNLAAGSYAFKVTNGTWDEEYPVGYNNNKTFEVATACDVTITFDETTKDIKVTGTGLAGALAVSSVHVAGNGVADNPWVNGIEWSSDAEENKMTANNGVYTITYNAVPAGEYQFKFTINGGWAHSLGLANKIVAGQATDLVYGADNIWLDVPATSNVTITLDMTGFDTVAMTGAKATVTVTAVEGGDQGDDKEEEKKPEAEITEITVHAQVPADWGTPKVWAWNDNGNLSTENWPGNLVMTQDENGWWTIKVPVGMKGVLILNSDGTKQTVDINVEQQKMDIWAAVGAAGSDGKFAVDVDYTIPKTGVETALVGAAVVMALAMGATALVLTNKKKFGI